MAYIKSIKLLTLSLMLVAGSIACDADNIVLWEKNGSNISYNLEDTPKITYKNANLCIKTEKINIEYPLADIHKITFGDATKINNITENKSEGIIKTTKDGVILSGFETEIPVYVYSESGQQILTRKTSKNGSLSISLRNKKRGIYIIKINNTTLKIPVGGINLS